MATTRMIICLGWRNDSDDDDDVENNNNNDADDEKGTLFMAVVA